MAREHAELIKAWADGAKIEYLSSGGTWGPASNPVWGSGKKYRVKPEPVELPAVNSTLEELQQVCIAHAETQAVVRRQAGTIRSCRSSLEQAQVQVRKLEFSVSAASRSNAQLEKNFEAKCDEVRALQAHLLAVRNLVCQSIL